MYVLYSCIYNCNIKNLTNIYDSFLFVNLVQVYIRSQNKNMLVNRRFFIQLKMLEQISK